MTSRFPTGSRLGAGGRALMFAAMLLGLGGCGFGLGIIGHHPAERLPVPPAKPAPPIVEDKVAEAREQAALEPARPYWPYRLGELFFAADSLGAAEAALETALARDSSYVPALSLLSKIDFVRGRHREAIRRLEAARARASDFPAGFPAVLLAGLALHYDAIDRPDLAKAALRDVPASAKDVASAAFFVTLRGDHPDSAAGFDEIAIDADSKNAVNQNNHGITRLRAGDPDGARKAFLAAIERNPRLPGPYYNLAILEKYYAFDDEKAASWIKAYRELSRDDPDSLFGVFDKSETKNVAGAENGR